MKSSRLPRAVILLAALLSLGIAARADLKWQATRLEFHPAAADQEVNAAFPFTNIGAEPVSIDSVKTGCGCTTATLEKLTYQPGESGRVEATFHIGDRIGIQDKVIQVWIHGIKGPVLLSMVTFVPELMRIEPKFVFWREGDPPVPRQIRLTLLPDANLGSLHVISLNPKFKAALVPLRSGSLYMLNVTPTDTAAQAAGPLIVEAMAGSAVSKKFQIIANIIPK